MRASRSITLTLLAAVSATSLTACDEDPTIRQARAPVPEPVAPVDPGADQMFRDEASCAAQVGPEVGPTETDAAACAEGAKQAQEEHGRTAPRFPGREACEASGSECVEDPARPGLFLPVMAGFLLGRLVTSGPRAIPLYAGPNPGPDCRANPQAAGCRTGSGGGVGGASYYYGGRGYYGSAAAAPGGAVPISRPANVAPAFSAPSALGRTPSVSTVSRGGFGGSASAHAGAGS